LIRQLPFPGHRSLGLLLRVIVAASPAVAVCIPVSELVAVLITRYVAFLLRAQIDPSEVDLADLAVAVLGIVDVGRIRGEDAADSDADAVRPRIRVCVSAAQY